MNNHKISSPKQIGIDPIKCLNDRCYSPVACEGFGYCREYNFTPADLRPACPYCDGTGMARGYLCAPCDGWGYAA